VLRRISRVNSAVLGEKSSDCPDQPPLLTAESLTVAEIPGEKFSPNMQAIR